jgi:hypothetical protein
MHYQMIKKALISLVIFFWFISLAVGQYPMVRSSQNEGKFGLGAYFSSEQSGLLLPFWLTDNFVLIPTLHLKYFQKQDLDFTLGLNTRHYLSVEELAVYFGFRVGSMLFIPYAQEEMDKSLRSDLFAGITFGTEYFFSRNFSVGMEVQAEFYKSDERSQRFNNPGGYGFSFAPVIMTIFYF